MDTMFARFVPRKKPRERGYNDVYDSYNVVDVDVGKVRSRSLYK